MAFAPLANIDHSMTKPDSAATASTRSRSANDDLSKSHMKTCGWKKIGLPYLTTCLATVLPDRKSRKVSADGFYYPMRRCSVGSLTLSKPDAWWPGAGPLHTGRPSNTDELTGVCCRSCHCYLHKPGPTTSQQIVSLPTNSAMLLPFLRLKQASKPLLGHKITAHLK